MSQVFHYVVGLARRGVLVELHTFEKAPVSAVLVDELARAGVDWRRHSFGRIGSLGGLWRVARGGWATRRSAILHARGDVVAACALVGRAHRWIWDMRSFWREQRVALGMLKSNSMEARVLRWIETRAARQSSAIVVLADAAVPVLAERFGPSVTSKCHVISTCVDLDRFTVRPNPASSPLRLLLAGTLNTYYDIPTTLQLVNHLRRRMPVTLTIAAPSSTPWDDLLSVAGAERVKVSPEDMPALVREHHAGLCVCRFDAGISLRAAMPTKIAEFLASGRPIIVNRGLGDADVIAETYGCGVVLESPSGDALTQAATGLLKLLADPKTIARCREAAERFFSLERAIDQLVQIYEVSASS